MITHRERLQACLAGQPLDRPPVALWRHFPVDDQHPETLAAATLHWQKTYDFDLVKVTPASSFCVRDWGVEDKWTGNSEGTRDYTKRTVLSPKDWESLPALNPTAPHLAGQLACLRLIRAGLGPDVPLLQTVFSPLAQAKNLAGNDVLLAHIRLYPEAVTKGLAAIAETTRRFAQAALEAGADGIFYAIQHAQAGLLNKEEYETFGLPFDRHILEAAGRGWCNMLHLHGHNVHFDLASRLPVHIVNWHDRESAPNLAEAQKNFAGAVCGGIRQDTLVYADPAEVRREAADALQQTRGRKFILSTGCVVPVIAPHGNITAARRSVEA